jgi:tartrate dehydrogenase/decarboxylase/D-malate dehydrogenase
MVFWDEVFHDLQAEYPDVSCRQYHVDALAARFVTAPESLDVVVGSNLFADILSDLGGALQGSLGIPPSANINPERTHPSMFEPVHGSAPDIAKTGKANPVAAILSAALMLRHIGEAQAAEAVEDAVESYLAESEHAGLPWEFGGKAATPKVGKAIAERVKSGRS